MLAEFFSWWSEELRDLAAPLAHRAAGRSKNALVLACHTGARDPADAVWRILRRRKGVTSVLATLPADATVAMWRSAFAARRRGEPVVVTIGRPCLVRRTTVPLAASANLGQPRPTAPLKNGPADTFCR